MPVALPVLFTPAAQAEIIEAQDWYEAHAPGLGVRFRAELDRTAQRMAANPLQFPASFGMCAAPACARFPTGCSFASSQTH